MRSTYFPGCLTGCLVLASVLLTGCGGGDGGSSTGSATKPDGSSNAAPSVSGTPGASAVVGQAYSFQPAATDADGDRLTFTVANLPSWASFSAETGRISGTPTAAQVGAYENITITVSDGAASAQLGPFAINVTDVSSNSATLSWTPPTQNADGSALSNLAGYQVRYGRSLSNLDQTVNLDNPSINRYVVENLSAGTWYFAVVAVNSRGATSEISNTASKTVT
ncbi:fibronectin type III domain-containing protein [Steroidobacter sp. S1-65]|uniref:Fibronectin type III domain-containing protein n=1 Tax=Steroidobacter gossypii TaxID=2805490 RepID=A0ABS1WZ11_9GAMM|nr:putative Ig domain-containing protein [Steroidobacter gossypii]MBM0106187.1 fibronectin type III domain-containing protein [Steroidobacter gossypii]